MSGRIAAFVAIVVAIVAVVVYVVRADIDRRNADHGASLSTVSTFPSPPPPGGGSTSMAPGSTTPLPAPGALTGSSLAIELEQRIRTETGWTHKVTCDPAGAVAVGSVLSCTAATEPPIREVPPSTIIAVVVAPDRAVAARGRGGPFSADVLLGEPDQTCAAMLDAGYPYVSALAWWWLHDRPPALVEGEALDRPCVETYGPAAVDAAFAAAVGPDLGA
ncbi:MAG: hypothetical protein R2699_09785 [Acidimicrobiales bacterium]